VEGSEVEVEVEESEVEGREVKQGIYIYAYL
jgi:hypothetical protein